MHLNVVRRLWEFEVKSIDVECELSVCSLLHTSTEKQHNLPFCGLIWTVPTPQSLLFIHMDPMSDVTMWRRPCVADFGHAISSWHWRWLKSLTHELQLVI